jgi:outer membrane immunogenic protein
MSLRKFTSVLLATTALGFAGSAFAADVYAPAPEEQYRPPPETFSWTGIHFGVGGGGQFDFAPSHVSAYDYYYFSGASSDADLGAAAGFVTAEIGADVQMQNFVVGAFANYDWHPTKGTASQDSCGGIIIIGACVSNTVTWGDSWAVGGRFGTLINPQTLLYIVGGYAQKQITTVSDHNLDGGDEGLSAGGWRGGYFLGGGLEARLSKHVSLKGEYRWARYGGIFDSSDCVGICDDGDYQEVEVGSTNSHTIRAVLSYHWGWGP